MKVLIITALLFLLSSPLVRATKGTRRGLGGKKGSNGGGNGKSGKKGKTSPSGDDCFFEDINENREFTQGAVPFFGIGNNFLCNNTGIVLGCGRDANIGELSGMCNVLTMNTATGITENCDFTLTINGDVLILHSTSSNLGAPTSFEAVVTGGTGCYKDLNNEIVTVRIDQDLSPPRYTYELGGLL